MPLFRRKKGEKDEPSEGTSKRAGLRGRRAAPEVGGSSAPSELAGPPESKPSPAPPPLPSPPPANPAEAASLAPRTDYSECFVCGSALEGKRCPRCRMTWVE